MSEKWMKRSAAFAAVVAVAASIAWVGGFDFDRRDHDVALCVFFTLLAGVLAAYVSTEELP